MNTTVSASSTASTIVAPPQPERGGRAAGRERGRSFSTAAIVASLAAHTGKTLLARILTDYFMLSGTRPLVFDTDAAGHGLRAAFPFDIVAIDLDSVRDQVILFDTLAARLDQPRVADVSHHVVRKFFKLMQQSDFVPEARARRVEPVVFFIVDRSPGAYAEAAALREHFADCALVLVENVFVGEPRDATRRSPAYQALAGHPLRMTVPRLDPAIAEAVEDMGFSLGEVISRPLSRGDAAPFGGLSFEDRELLRAWLLYIFRDIHRVIRAAGTTAPPLMPAGEPA
jgi:hypothetical protein